MSPPGRCITSSGSSWWMMGSTDQTVSSLRELPVTVLRHANNLGKAAALRRGMRHAVAQGASAIITLDGDGQHDPGAIPALLAMHRRDPRAIVVAARRGIATRFRDSACSHSGLPTLDLAGSRLYDRRQSVWISALSISAWTAAGCLAMRLRDSCLKAKS